MLEDTCACPEYPECPECVRRVIYRHVPELSRHFLHDYPKIRTLKEQYVDFFFDEVTKKDVIAIASVLVLCYFVYEIIEERFFVPRVRVQLTAEERIGRTGKKWIPGTKFPENTVPCYDPGSLDILGPDLPAMKKDEVVHRIKKARVAQKEWARSSWRQRRFLLKIIRKFVIENQDDICVVSARDSGKPLVDAAFGEVITTLEKIRWLLKEGEMWLRPEKRSSGAMMFYKKATLEFHPVGVMGAIVPWNYPFHNVFNPLVANVFAGNALVVKVSEHASWSSQYYGRAIKECLKAAGAPEDLVQIVTGYGEAGEAIVNGGCQKVVFVGSTTVGRLVMKSAAKTLTPVVLELGGKDAFIVCADANLNQCVPMALRGAFQSCGQNCAGAERFYVHEKVYDEFVKRVVETTKKLRQGHALKKPFATDCGAMCMPNQAKAVHMLIEDAVSKGAICAVGGYLPKIMVTSENIDEDSEEFGNWFEEYVVEPVKGGIEQITGSPLTKASQNALKKGDKKIGEVIIKPPPPGATKEILTGQFYPPTVLLNVTHDMRIMREEVFGPVLSICKVSSDEEAIRLANDCDFGLGSNVFAGSRKKAERIGKELEAGMTSVNDFCSTYMAQSLPFGGVKESGFDRFAGVEGLRGCCVPKSVVVDRFPFIKTDIPPPLQYPVKPNAFQFCKSLCYMFFGGSVLENFKGLLSLIACFVFTPKNPVTARKQ
jgi:acyl-CoA reductase-like NAD-dependent aldehyde dehydrogenase